MQCMSHLNVSPLERRSIDKLHATRTTASILNIDTINLITKHHTQNHVIRRLYALESNTHNHRIRPTWNVLLWCERSQICAEFLFCYFCCVCFLCFVIHSFYAIRLSCCSVLGFLCAFFFFFFFVHFYLSIYLLWPKFSHSLRNFQTNMTKMGSTHSISA